MEHIKALLTKKAGRGSRCELAITGAVLICKAHMKRPLHIYNFFYMHVVDAKMDSVHTCKYDDHRLTMVDLNMCLSLQC